MCFKRFFFLISHKILRTYSSAPKIYALYAVHKRLRAYINIYLCEHLCLDTWEVNLHLLIREML